MLSRIAILMSGAARNPVLSLNFLEMTTLDQLIDFTRTSSATYVDATGKIVSTPASRNLLTFTQEFNNAAWTKTAASAYPFDPATAPLSANVIQNGDFSSGASWSLSATSPATATIAGGKLTLVSPAGESAAANQSTLKLGSWYKVTGTVVVRSGTVKVICGGPTEFYFSATQTFTIYTQANGNTTFSLSRQTACDADFDDIVVQEITVGIPAPDGTLTADTLLASAGAGISPLLIQTGTTVTSSVYTASLFVRPGTHTFVQFYIGSQSADWCNFTLTGNGSVQNNGAAVGAISYNSSTGWYRISMVYTAGGVDRRPGLAIVPSGTATRVQTGTYAGTETIFIWGAQLEAVPDANLVLGSELRSTGTTGLNGTATAATYNTLTGEGSVTRVDISNQSFVSVGNLSPTATYRVAVTVSTGAILLRVGTSTGTALATLTAGTHTVYVVPTETLVFASSAGTSTFTLSSIREFTGTTGMPTDYTRNFGGVYPPRFDYDPVTLAPRGLLIEDQRTNLLVRSEEFDNAFWQKTNITVTSAATVSPDGTTNAQRIAATASAVTNIFSTNAAVAATSATYSVYVKQGTGPTTANSFAIRNNTTATTLLLVTVNLATGTVISYINGTTGASLQNAGNGWWRVVLTVTSGVTSGDLLSGYIGFVGSAQTAGNHLFAWGAQLEAGAFATSYIPTAASQVTRSRDEASINAPNFASWYNSVEGTLLVEGSVLSTAGGGQCPTAGFDDGTASNRYIFFKGTGTAALTAYVNANATGNLMTLTANTPFKAALAFNSTGIAACANGGSVSTASGTTTGINRLSMGQNIGSISVLPGHIRSIRYYNTRLSNAQLQALTA